MLNVRSRTTMAVTGFGLAWMVTALPAAAEPSSARLGASADPTAPVIGGVASASAVPAPAATGQVFGQCFYSVSPTSISNVSAAGASGSLTVSWHYEPDPLFPDEEDESVCADNWGASSGVAWISVRESNTDTATYTVSANTTTAARTGTLTVARETVTISQLPDYACTVGATGGGQVDQAISLSGTLTPSNASAVFRWKATRIAGGQPVETHSPGEGASSTFTPGNAGRWVFGLTVQQPRGTNLATCTAERTVTLPNRRPVADAGANQTVDEGDTVALNGTGSSDPDGDTLTHAWTQTSGTSVTLTNASTASPRFTAPLVSSDTSLRFTLTVSDGDLSASDGVTVTVQDTTEPNRRPVADAGANQTVDEGDTVSLNGTGSSDPEGDTLSYAWSQTSGTTVTLTGGSTSSPTFTAPQVTADTSLVFTLTVSDGDLSATDTVTVAVQDMSPANRRPVADAGADQTVDEGSTVTLDGTGSSDPEGVTLTYAWTSGTTVTLTGGSTSSPTFTAPQVTADTSLVFTLTVSDGDLSATDTVTVTVQDTTEPNRAPVADAGPNQTVDEGDAATLNGTGSSDPDGNTLTYAWTQTSGTSVTLTGASTSSPTFTPPQVTYDRSLVFTLTVSDGEFSSTDTVTVRVRNTRPPNRRPVANAGADQTVDEGATVMLDASGSSDADGDRLSYTWTQTGGTTVTLSSVSTSSPTFTAPQVTADTSLVFRLTVSDGRLSATDTVTVAVQDTEPEVTLNEHRKRLFEDWVTRNNKGDVCTAYNELPPGAREVFIWNTHRLHLSGYCRISLSCMPYMAGIETSVEVGSTIARL